VVRVAVEVSGHVTDKPYPKSRAGRRVVSIPGLVVKLLTDHKRRYPPCAAELVFTSRSGAVVRCTTFRAKVWRPSLVRAGLLGKVVEVGEHKFMAHWQAGAGCEWSKAFTTSSPIGNLAVGILSLTLLMRQVPPRCPHRLSALGRRPAKRHLAGRRLGH